MVGLEQLVVLARTVLEKELIGNRIRPVLFTDAISTCERILKIRIGKSHGHLDREAGLYSQRGSMLVEVGDYLKARGVSYLAKAMYTLAERDLAMAFDISNRIHLDGNIVDAAINLAYARIEQGKFADAQDILLEHGRFDPLNAGVPRLMGALLIKTRRPALAISPLLNAVELSDPGKIASFAYLGDAREGVGDDELAARSRLKGLDFLDDKNPDERSILDYLAAIRIEDNLVRAGIDAATSFRIEAEEKGLVFK